MEPSPEQRARNGARRSPITMPGHRKGLPAPNKGRRFPAEPLTPGEVEALLAACSTRGSSGIRDRALIALLWRTGVRIDEALRSEPRDVDLERLTFYVRFPKRDRKGRAFPRYVPIDAPTAALLERWLKRRAELGIGPRKALFCVIDKRSRGKPIYASVFREKLKALAEKAGIEKRVHPHGFRHTCAVDLHHREKAPAQLVQKWLGHRSLETTARYLDHFGADELIAWGHLRRWPFELEDQADVDDDAAAA